MLAFGLSAALLLGSIPSGAQSDDENARRHFESGAAYLQQSDYENALREFQAAYNLSKRPPLLLNIANVYERMGKLQDAVDALTKYLEEDAKTPERATHETRIANLKKRIEAMPKPAPVASTAPVTSAAPPPVATAAPPPPPPPVAPPPASAPNRTPAFIAFGVGGAAAIGAVVTGLVAKGKYDDAEKECKPNCPDKTIDSIKSMALVSDVLSGVAIVGVGVGAVLLLTAGGSKETATSGVKPFIAGGVGPNGGKLEATWRF
ncbi:MAG: tetratricopeptide repeat protein [Polyangiaceae bacterium]